LELATEIPDLGRAIILELLQLLGRLELFKRVALQYGKERMSGAHPYRCTSGSPAFADKFNQTVAKAWRVFNTEDLVPTLPLSTIDNDPQSLGLLDTNIELVLKLLFKPSPFLFQHVDSPVALTYQLNTVAGNHSLTQLYSRSG
jgi:hypothetical protein